MKIGADMAPGFYVVRVFPACEPCVLYADKIDGKPELVMLMDSEGACVEISLRCWTTIPRQYIKADNPHHAKMVYRRNRAEYPV